MATGATPVNSGAIDMGAFSCVLRAWETHEGELRGFLHNRLRDADTADDVLQDTFVKAMREGQGLLYERSRSDP